MPTPTQRLIEHVDQLTDAEIVEMVSERDPVIGHIVELRLKQLRLKCIQQTQKEMQNA